MSITSRNTKAEILEAYQALLKEKQAAAQENEAAEEKQFFADLVEYLSGLEDSELKTATLKWINQFGKLITKMNQPLPESAGPQIQVLHREFSKIYPQLDLNNIPESFGLIASIIPNLKGLKIFDTIKTVFDQAYQYTMIHSAPPLSVQFSEDPTAGAVCSLIMLLDEDEVKKLHKLIHTQRPIYNRINGVIKD